MEQSTRASSRLTPVGGVATLAADTGPVLKPLRRTGLHRCLMGYRGFAPKASLEPEVSILNLKPLVGGVPQEYGHWYQEIEFLGVQ